MEPSAVRELPLGIMNIYDAKCASLCNVARRLLFLYADLAWSATASAFLCSFDVDARPWGLSAYMRRQVRDAVHVVAQALDSIITNCGDPMDASLLGATIRSSAFKSQSGAATPAPSISFDSQGRRMANLNLGNLIGNAWAVAGSFIPSLSRGMAFRPTVNIIRWPKTLQTPRDWFECAGGEQFTEDSGSNLSSCMKCKAGTYRTFPSPNSSCTPCSAGVLHSPW